MAEGRARQGHDYWDLRRLGAAATIVLSLEHRHGRSHGSPSGPPPVHGVGDDLFEGVDSYVVGGFELDTIPRNLRFSQSFAVGVRQVSLVIQSDYIDRYSSCICAQADSIEFPLLPVGILARR